MPSAPQHTAPLHASLYTVSLHALLYTVLQYISAHPTAPQCTPLDLNPSPLCRCCWGQVSGAPKGPWGELVKSLLCEGGAQTTRAGRGSGQGQPPLSGAHMFRGITCPLTLLPAQRLLAVQGTLKSLLQHHSSKASIVWCSAFFISASGKSVS